MRVQMKVKISGTRNGEDWPEVGEILELPADEAVGLLAGGLAEPVEAQPETATAPAPEDTAAAEAAAKKAAEAAAKKAEAEAKKAAAEAAKNAGQ